MTKKTVAEMYSSLVAATTKHHELVGIEQQVFRLSQPWRLEAHRQVAGRIGSY